MTMSALFVKELELRDDVFLLVVFAFKTSKELTILMHAFYGEARTGAKSSKCAKFGTGRKSKGTSPFL